MTAYRAQPGQVDRLLKAPFPYFGGKSRVAPVVWEALGDVGNYIEPFFGSGAVLLARPDPSGIETVNDADGLLANFWRAVTADPEAVADHADWPVNEADLHARHLWLVGQRDALTDRLMGDPAWFDSKAAGWWVWGACAWIGGGWCSGEGPWTSHDGLFVDRRNVPHLGECGKGVTRGLPRLGDRGNGVNRQLPHLRALGKGVKRQLPQPADRRSFITDWMTQLSARMREVRVACGDWSRVCGPSVRHFSGTGICGVFLDPPYSQKERAKVYAHESDIAADVLEWARLHGHDPKLRIVLAGYEGEHNELTQAGWSVVGWKAPGGYGRQSNGRGRDNAARERLWLSPHCVKSSPGLFDEAAA